MIRAIYTQFRSVLKKAVQAGLNRTNPTIVCKLPSKKSRESSGDVFEPGKKDPDEQDGNPSTGVKTSLIPLAIAAAIVVAATKCKKK